MEDCSSLDQWGFRPAFLDSCWIGESFAGENEALTRALQISLSDDSSGSTFPSPDSASSPLLRRLAKPEPAAGSGRNRSSGVLPPPAKIVKRKSRASKRSPTTYITADPANFRQMVQQVTGIRFGEPGLPVDPVRPEPQRAGPPAHGLPTLDTSAFLLDRCPAGSGSVQNFEFEPYPIFPTLESWGVM